MVCSAKEGCKHSFVYTEFHAINNTDLGGAWPLTLTLLKQAQLLHNNNVCCKGV